ncbi:MAG: response regulator [Myxococcota bacterium]
MVYDFAYFGLHDVVDCMEAIESIGDEVDDLAAFSERLVRLFEERFVYQGRSALVLARCFLTQPYRVLSADLQARVRDGLGSIPGPDLTCLTLQATRGERPQWCDVRGSVGHQAIPLVSAEQVQGIPMIARLLEQLGVPVSLVLAPSTELLLEAAETRYNVFFVPEALGSPFIPAQEDFVEPYGIRSVLGFGSLLPTGGLYVTILFSRQSLPAETAQAFRTLALSVRLAALNLLRRERSATGGVESSDASGLGLGLGLGSGLGFQQAYTHSVFSAQRQLLEVFRTTVRAQSDALTEAMHALTERNAMLSQTRTQLEQALREAQAANTAKGEFLANMSHEIRTPMNGVLGMLGLLQESSLTDQQQEFATTARQSAQALLDILNDILDLSKIESGHITLESIAFDVVDVVQSIADQIALQAYQKGLEVVVRLAAPDRWKVMGDPGRLRQILLNLANNAVKFTEQGHVLLSVDGEARDGHAHMRFRVSDSGVGIPASQQDKIFEKFRQMDGSATRSHGGTGLGLSIVKELVERMGGAVHLTSKEGEGSSFDIELVLPLADALPKALPSGDTLHGCRVLVVDDNAINRRVLEEQITRWGMEPTVCASGLEAIEQLRRAHEQGAPFDIVVLDYQMPVLSGLDTARVIQGDPALRETVLILFTSVTRMLDEPTIRQAGFSGYLTKPIHQSDLFDTMVLAWSIREQSTPVPLITRAQLRQDDTEEREPCGDRLVRVLVVEDNAVNQKVATRLLEGLGCTVDVASNGQEGLEMLESFPYDVAFMDIQMPVMDGLTATQLLRHREREQPGAGHQYLVAMTAHTMRGDRERCLAAGMDDYVAKPVVKRDLAKTLARWKQYRARSEACERVLEGSSASQCDVAGVAKAGDEFGGAGSSSSESSSLVTRIDWNHLQEVSTGDGDILREIIETFVVESQEQLRCIESAQARGDRPAIRVALHTLKGACGAVGARGIQELVTSLYQEPEADAAQALPRLRRMLTSTVVALRGQPG